MAQPVISVDVMGGDHGSDVILSGIEKVLVQRSDARFLLFGDEQIVRPALTRRPRVESASTLTHCDMSIAMDAKPSVALRQGRKVSSMWQAIAAVKSGAAQACISAGNTGALMAMSKVVLRTLPGIERPAIVAVWPTIRGRSVVLDVGATIGGPASQYAQFAVMGAAYGRAIFNIPNPTIGLLNIGVEDVKGTDSVREAADLLARSELNFTGFIEGDGIGRGDADVIVTDGFTGNIALKTAEGTARQIAEYLRQAMGGSVFSRLGYIFARSAFKNLRQRMDPAAANGGMFLGLNGIVVKSHGGADASGFAAAVALAVDVADADISQTIAADIEKMQLLLDDAWAQTLD